MDANRRWWILALLAMLAAAGCTGNSLDDGSSANVVLSVLDITNPAVTGQLQTGTCNITTTLQCLSASDCPINEACILPVDPGLCTITEWTVTMQNVPKVEIANTSPFNDVTIRDITLSYTWVDGVTTTPTRTIPVGLTIPADLVTGNTSVNLLFDINAATADGESVRAAAGSQLIIENCVPAP